VTKFSLKLTLLFCRCTGEMSSPSNTDTDRRLQQLSARCYIDNNRTNRLERQLAALSRRVYLLCFLTLFLAILITMILARMQWKLVP
jgi:hypothetical protein